MATETKPNGRFQFALRDLLLIVVACAVWLAILPPLSTPRSFDDRFESPFRYPLWACIAALVVVLLSGVSSLILTASPRIDPHGRSGWLALSLVLGPFLFLVAIAIPMSGVRVDTHAQFTSGRMEMLVVGQEAYRLDHGEYASDLGKLGPYVPSSSEGPWNRAEGLPGQPGVRPIGGYVFRILKAQGPHAPGGRKSYFKTDKDGKERMTEGFAILAVPASGERGIVLMIAHCADSTLLVGKAFGPDAAQIAGQITEFDPDETWIEVRR